MEGSVLEAGSAENPVCLGDWDGPDGNPAMASYFPDMQAYRLPVRSAL
jgi:hypothetical protein